MDVLHFFDKEVELEVLTCPSLQQWKYEVIATTYVLGEVAGLQESPMEWRALLSY